MPERSSEYEPGPISPLSIPSVVDSSTAPDLIELTRRVSECPPDFLTACQGERGAERIVAIIADHFRDQSRTTYPTSLNELFATLLQTKVDPSFERYLQVLSIVAWLLHDHYFVSRQDLTIPASEIVTHNYFKRLSELVHPQQMIADPDRREELVRFCLDQFGIYPRGETATQSADRLISLNSVERQRILQATADAQKRAREIREAMTRKQALESASRYGE